MATYYIDTNNFSTATAVWTNAGLTIKAPDGYYSIGGNYRRQLSGLLYEINPCSPISTPISITNVSFSEAETNKCQKVKVTVTTSELATKINAPFQLNGNSQNPFTFEWIRGKLSL